MSPHHDHESRPRDDHDDDSGVPPGRHDQDRDAKGRALMPADPSPAGSFQLRPPVFCPPDSLRVRSSSPSSLTSSSAARQVHPEIKYKKAHSRYKLQSRDCDDVNSCVCFRGVSASDGIRAGHRLGEAPFLLSSSSTISRAHWL
eukprot:1968090-Rhodomonas_salina.1